jgi:osmotically-inducible protein OsmY
MRSFLWFLIGIALGAYAMRQYDRRGGADGYVAQQQQGWNRKIEEWHLTPDDVRNDLSRTGEVVRTNARAVGGELNDARVVATIKAKYLLDSDLSAIDIHVESHQGDVLLTGEVANRRLVGRAVALALDTGGVRRVVARLHAKS